MLFYFQKGIKSSQMGEPNVTKKGSLCQGFHANYYLRALSICSLKEPARKLACELDEGFAAGYFNGRIGMGNEFFSWEGLRTGYEDTLIGSFSLVYSIAIEQGLITAPDPEWWPVGD
jgi:hypothetical protein